MRRAKTQKMDIYEGGNEQGNSSSRKSKGSGGTIIIMNNAAQDISALNGSAGWDGVREGGLLIDTLVGASGVVIVDKLDQNAPQVSKIEDQDQIQALLPGRKNPAFRESIGIRGSDRRGDNMEAFGLENVIKSLAKRAIIIMDQEAQGLFSLGKLPNQLPGLLSDPDLIGIGCDTGEMDAARTQLDEEEHVNGPQQDGFYCEKVTG